MDRGVHRNGLHAGLLALQLLTSPSVTFDLHDGKVAADIDGSRPGRAAL
ncbi:MAG TPA: hypothetical protein VGG51_00615 [Candidatus Cybelea sp.]